MMQRRLFGLFAAAMGLMLAGCVPEAPETGAGGSGSKATGTTTETVNRSGRPGTRIEVSLSKQNVVVYEKGKVAMRMRAIVGSPSRPTPVMRDRISSIKFAPEWNPPKTILEKDIYPELKRNPRFLYRGWTVYSGGKKIDPKSVDWKTANLKNYRFVQDSGGVNALGSIRFTMHNNQAIFIHDTPFKARFGSENDRYASSGCIRVEQAGRLASWMLRQDGQGKIAKDVNKLKKGPTKTVGLNKSVPVFVDA